MITAFWSTKGGEGTSITAALAAEGASAAGPTTLVDLGNDQWHLFRGHHKHGFFPAGNTGGGATPGCRGVNDWARGGFSADAVDDIAEPVGRNLVLMGPGEGPLCEPEVDEMLPRLAEMGTVIVDAGTLDPWDLRPSPHQKVRRRLIEGADRSYLVVRPTYAALRRAARANVTAGLIPYAKAAVMVDDHPRLNGKQDVERAVGYDVAATVPYTPQIANAANEGRIASVAWTPTVQTLSSLVVDWPRRFTVGDSLMAMDWCDAITSDNRPLFIDGASWAIQNRWGDHTIDLETGDVETINPPFRWNLAPVAEAISHNTNPDEWRANLFYRIGDLRPAAEHVRDRDRAEPAAALEL